MGEVIVQGRNLRVVLEESDLAKRIFSQKDQNNVARSAMFQTISFWANVFLPMRFMKSKQGAYQARTTEAWSTRKQNMLITNGHTKDGRSPTAPQPLSMVFTGALMNAVLSGHREDARATGAKPVGTCYMPTGHAVKQSVMHPLRYLPNFEQTRLVEVFKKALAEAMQYGEAKQAAIAQSRMIVKANRQAAKKIRSADRAAARKASAVARRSARQAQRARK